MTFSRVCSYSLMSVPSCLFSLTSAMFSANICVFIFSSAPLYSSASTE